ncbi:GlxA family transcriptional regulator [Faunimonas pinastri]|uniref:GlxA family transcriptional regulator n=1 Tax=Faunimonas pinastri TaxID=1855383 RepID=UPI001EE9C6E4|nr:GlxA family transcriptional regulator [Faunimonas pinastri]
MTRSTVTHPAGARSTGTRSIDPGSLTRFGFLTLPNYSMIACSAAIEACRMANYIAGEAVYSWTALTLDGMPAPSSSGFALSPTVVLGDAGPLDVVFVCGGINVRHAVDRRLKDELRRLDRRGIALGALCTGTFALAEADLLDGYRCAIHWENLHSIREEFEDVQFTEDLFVIDRDRFTCTGGIAPLDMMAVFVEARLGRDAVVRMSDQFIVDRVRHAGEPQHPPARSRFAVTHPELERAAGLMRRTIDAPLSVTVVAQRIGLSPRQLERLFKLHLATSPGEFYVTLRLDRARELLRLSELSVTDIGLACGFQSAAHFSAAYRRRFGHSPRAERNGKGAPSETGASSVSPSIP